MADLVSPQLAQVLDDRPRLKPAREPELTIDQERSEWWSSFLEKDAIDVSVCIANWNCRNMLRRCLESLLDQPQGVRLEVIVVDNGSMDGAADVVAREFPEVVLIRNTDNHGFARANNQAAEVAKGRYLFFLNNDTLVPAHALRQLLEFAEAHPEAGLIGPRLRDADGEPQVSYRAMPTLATLLHRTSLLRWTGLLRSSYQQYRRRDFDPESTREVEVLMGAAMLLPRDVFFSCGRWDEDFSFGGEDLDLSYRVGCTRKVVFHPRVEITHFGRVSTRQHIGYASSKMAIGFVRYLRKTGCSPLALLGYKAVVTADAPVQYVGKSLQYLWRRFRGRKQDAKKSKLAMRGLRHFMLRELAEFWQA